MPTVQQIAAQLIRQSADGLARTAKSMPEERHTWQPLDVGRDALDQVQECAGISLFAAQILRERIVPPFEPEAYDRLKAETDTMEKAIALLGKGTDALVAAVEAFPDEHLGDSVTLPFGGGMTMTYSELFFLNYWNTVYHIGQVNYIQTLYGDKDMH